jgi:hypothetical protein
MRCADVLKSLLQSDRGACNLVECSRSSELRRKRRLGNFDALAKFIQDERTRPGDESAVPTRYLPLRTDLEGNLL